MATLNTTAHIRRSPFLTSTTLLPSPSSNSNSTKKLNNPRCALSPQKWRESRRLVSLTLFLSPLIYFPSSSMAGNLMDKYVKRKKLDPLEVYVPAVILTELQIKDLDKTLEVDQPQYDACRSLLRSGPASSLRVNIRAVAQYASDAGNGKAASNDVDQCLRALEELDSLLLRASRKDQNASVKSMKAEVGVALNALDSLLQTVPPDVLDKAKSIADAYRTPEEEYSQAESSDPEIKQLESIL